MSKEKFNPTRRIGLVFLFAFMGLIVFGMTIRTGQGGDGMFWLMRWPFWLVICVALPLVFIRVFLWNKIRWPGWRKGPQSENSTEGEEHGSSPP